jgi:hypothetical protein
MTPRTTVEGWERDADLGASSDGNRSRFRPLVALFESSGLLNYDASGQGEVMSRGRPRPHRPGSGAVGCAPGDIGELHERYGSRIRYRLRTSGVRDVEDAYSALLERMLTRRLVENYEPRRGEFIKYMDGFVHWQILGRLKEQRRRDLRETLAEVPDRPCDEQGYSEVEYILCLIEVPSSSSLGGALLHCAALTESTGTVTGALLARRMGVSPQMARRHLARLRSTKFLWWPVLTGATDQSWEDLHASVVPQFSDHGESRLGRHRGEGRCYGEA